MVICRENPNLLEFEIKKRPLFLEDLSTLYCWRPNNFAIKALLFNIKYIYIADSNIYLQNIQSVTGGTDQTSGECSLGHTIPI